MWLLYRQVHSTSQLAESDAVLSSAIDILHFPFIFGDVLNITWNEIYISTFFSMYYWKRFDFHCRSMSNCFPKLSTSVHFECKALDTWKSWSRMSVCLYRVFSSTYYINSKQICMFKWICNWAVKCYHVARISSSRECMWLGMLVALEK